MVVYSFSEKGNNLLASLSSMISSIFPDYNREKSVDDELVLITVDDLINDKEPIPEYWKKIHKAWQNIHLDDTQSLLKNFRIIWRYGEEIVPGLSVFRIRDSIKPVYFYLLENMDEFLASDKLNNLFCILSSWQHLIREKGFFHASGIYYQNAAYLFVGISGAGKTTIANFSIDKGYRVIHDDHVVVYQNKKGDYRVTDRTLSLAGIPLKAIFFLHQDTSDKLDQLSVMKTAGGLFNGCLDSVARMVLYGDLLKNTFRTSIDIARNVPGYNLYFKKSPDFWDIIHNELGNH